MTPGQINAIAGRVASALRVQAFSNVEVVETADADALRAEVCASTHENGQRCDVLIVVTEV